MSKKISHAILFIISFALLPSCIGEETEMEYIKVGDTLPLFSVTLNDGSTFTTATHDGRGYVIVFFSTLCNDCRRELPVIDSLYRHGNYADDHVVCIGRGESADVVDAFWNEQQLSLPYSPQPDRKIYSLFASSGVPRVYTADAHGIVKSIQRP